MHVLVVKHKRMRQLFLDSISNSISDVSVKFYLDIRVHFKSIVNPLPLLPNYNRYVTGII